MHHVLHLLYWILRRGPIGLLIVAAAVLGLGYYLQTVQNDLDAENAIALEAGPPAAVNITEYDREANVTDRGEVVVRAQAVLENAYRLTLEQNGPDAYAYMVPLVSPTAASDRVIFGVAVFSSRSFSFDDLTPEMQMRGIVGFGDFGPIIEYNGKIAGLGKWDELVDEALAIEGLTMAANSVVVWPYLDGREAAFSPQDWTFFGVFSKIAGGIALLALAKLVFRREPDAEPTLEQAVQAPAVEPFLQPDAPAQARSDVPLWKQRSGLVDTPADTFEDYVPQEPQFDAQPMRMADPAPVLPPKRAGFGVRKILIGLVAIPFLVLLVSTIGGLVTQSMANDQVVSIPTAQERAAQSIADVIVPEADPNRHWTDVDIGPAIEWVVAKFFLAVGGDQGAQAIMLVLIATPMVLMFALRWFFAVRRTLQPRTTARFDSMGIN